MRINSGSSSYMNSLLMQQNNNTARASSGGLVSAVSNKGNATSGWQKGSAGIDIESGTSVRKQMQQQLRDLFEKQQKTNVLTPMDQQEDIFGTQKEEDKKEDKLLESGNTYNFKEVSNKIMRAKTSISAGQAVVAAKRKISEIKRKMASSGDENTDDLQLALTHARKMEVVAQRKKSNLELEEMAKNTQKRDEMQDKLQESASSLKNDVLENAKDQIMDEQLQNIQEQAEISREETRQNREKIEEKLAEEQEKMQQMMESAEGMEDLVEEMSDAEMEAMREMSEMLDAMETIDPHMSEEELNKLKTKHRLSENKALMKADMDYLKGVFKSLDARGANGMTTLGQGMSFGGTVTQSPSMSPIGTGMNMTALEGGGGEPSLSVDVSV
ncbi:MAG: hypothetical protein K5857_08535 [Lachnospiraceae bacterium]|nr:hypothetical protein [Lachnospiraceae bacterium]